MNEKDLIQQGEVKTAEDAQLDKPITGSLLLMFGLPTIIAFLVMNTFNIVDGVFAMRALGAESMAAISVLTPFIIITIAIGILFSMGGSALVAKKNGMGLKHEARQNFTLISIVAFVLSSLVAAYAIIIPEHLLGLLGANYEIIDYAKSYLRIVAFSVPLVTVGQVFNQFLIADGKPGLGMGVSLLGSVLSAGLNAFFLFGLEWGIEGLGWATLIGYTVTVFIGIMCFARSKTGTLYFVAPRFDLNAIGISILNGSGAFISTVVASVVTIVMNNVLVRMDGIGAMGIAVAGMVMAVHATIGTLFTGYLAGTSPLISYNHGKGNHERQKALFKLNIKFLSVLAVIAVSVTLIFSNLLISIYVPAGTEIHEMAGRGLRIASMSFIFMGFNIFAAGQFAALNKGFIAGILSIVRTVGFNLMLLLTLPRIFDLTGVWMATPLSEAIAIIISISVLLMLGKKYNYLGNENEIYATQPIVSTSQI